MSEESSSRDVCPICHSDGSCRHNIAVFTADRYRGKWFNSLEAGDGADAIGEGVEPLKPLLEELVDRQPMPSLESLPPRLATLITTAREPTEQSLKSAARRAAGETTDETTDETDFERLLPNWDEAFCEYAGRLLEAIGAIADSQSEHPGSALYGMGEAPTIYTAYFVRAPRRAAKELAKLTRGDVRAVQALLKAWTIRHQQSPDR